MGLDVGEVRIGVAVSDETELIAQGVSTLHRVGWKKDLPSLLQTIREYQVGRIVVGNPISMDGTASRQANLIQDFVRRLKEATPVEVTLWDERLSSLAAEKVLIEGGMQDRKSTRLNSSHGYISYAVFCLKKKKKKKRLTLYKIK